MEITDLIKRLEVIRKRLCAYGGGEGRCDCKFINLEQDNENHPFSEHGNGCPEIALSIEKLKEYKMLVTDFEETRKLVYGDARIRQLEDDVLDLQTRMRRVENRIKPMR